MLNITFKKAHESEACASGYRKLAEFLGGVDKYGENKPIPLSTVLESNGLNDTLWAFRCLVESPEESQKLLVEFACRCAEHVLINYEKLYPDDKRPRLAIEAARAFTEGRGTARAAADAAYAAHAAYAACAAAYAACAAAYTARAAADAAYAAAHAACAAAYAARAAYAADAAEKEWQKNTLLALLNKE